MSLLGNTINDLKSTINKRGGLAMENRFAVYMQPPAASLLNIDLQNLFVSAISGNFKLTSVVNDPRDIAILCESCSLPGRIINSIEYQTVRQSIKVPTGYSNEDVMFTFHLTNDYYVRKMFDKWMNAVVDFENYKVRYQSEYSTDVVIQQLNKQNLPIYGVRLRNAWPVSVNAISLNNSAENSIQKVSVSMAYDDFVTEGAVESAVSSVKTGIGGIKQFINFG